MYEQVSEWSLPYLLGMRGMRDGVSRYMYDDDPVPAPAFSFSVCKNSCNFRGPALTYIDPQCISWP